MKFNSLPIPYTIYARMLYDVEGVGGNTYIDY